MIIREHYLQQIRPFYHSDLIKIIITNDEIDYSTSVVRHINLKDFLLDGSNIL